MASSKSASVRDVIAAMDRIAPRILAESWDNVGLQVGAMDDPAGSILVALEATTEVVAQARRARAGTLVTHHPLMLRERKSFAEFDPIARLAVSMIRGRIALIAAHTNLDSVADGTNGVVADMAGLGADRVFLAPVENTADRCKFSVFVPESHAAAVIEAIASAGAGIIGNYAHCTFRWPGTGTYRPLKGARPFAGMVGKLEQQQELRIEAECPKGRTRQLIKAVRAVHPYEEMAFDLFTLESDPRPRHGLGLIGDLPKGETLDAIAARLRAAFGLAAIKVIGDGRKQHRRVAVCTGSGGEFVRFGNVGDATLFVTGEMNHHDAWEAAERGIAVVLLGHYESEVVVCAQLARRLQGELKTAGFSNAVRVCGGQHSPLRYVS